MRDLPEHVRRNRIAWDKWAPEYAGPGAAAWARDTPTWGIWGVPESQLRMLPGDLAGKDAIELGRGTAYVSAWLARRGARVVGIDNSEAQLATARGHSGVGARLAGRGSVEGAQARLTSRRERRVPQEWTCSTP